MPKSKSKKTKTIRGVTDFECDAQHIIIPKEEQANIVKSAIGKPIYDVEQGVASRKVIGYITKAWFVDDLLMEYEAEVEEGAKV